MFTANARCIRSGGGNIGYKKEKCNSVKYWRWGSFDDIFDFDIAEVVAENVSGILGC